MSQGRGRFQACLDKMAQINILRKIANKFFLGVIWLVVAMLVLASILVLFEMMNSNKINLAGYIIVSFAIAVILIFALFLLVLSTKYRKEIVLNDFEREEKWITLRKGFRSFFRKMIIFEIVFVSFMAIVGVYSLFNPSPESGRYYGVFMIIMGLVLFASAFQHLKKIEKLERK